MPRPEGTVGERTPVDKGGSLCQSPTRRVGFISGRSVCPQRSRRTRSPWSRRGRRSTNDALAQLQPSPLFRLAGGPAPSGLLSRPAVCRSWSAAERFFGPREHQWSGSGRPGGVEHGDRSRPAPSDPATIPAIQAASAVPYQTPPAWSVARTKKTRTTSNMPTNRTTTPRPMVSGASTRSVRRISKPPRAERPSDPSPAGLRRVRTSAAVAVCARGLRFVKAASCPIRGVG
jgi:hypothetical protein